jgi:hypothetical protein
MDQSNFEDEEVQQRPSYNSIELSEKSIEPDKNISGHSASRNLQLGNIDKNTFLHISHQLHFATICDEIDYEVGGWLSHDIGTTIRQVADQTILVGNSVNGFLRRMLRTNIKSQTFRDDSSSSSLGLFKSRSQ